MLVGNYQFVFVICSGKQELELKLAAVRLICEYVDVVMWFLSVGLLPEHPGLASVSTSYHRSTPCLQCLHCTIEAPLVFVVFMQFKAADQPRNMHVYFGLP